MKSRKKYKVQDLDLQKEVVVSQEELDSIDIRRLNTHDFHALFKDRSYSVQVLRTDLLNHQITLKINGVIRNFLLTNELRLHIDQLGLGKSRITRMDRLIAPMPGMVLKVFVKEGDMVSSGDSLCILEAMKMENILKATSPGKVKQVMVEISDVVDKGQVLIQFE